MSNIQLRTELSVILLDFNPVQNRKAVCRILIFLVYHENLVTISCFRTFYSSVHPTYSIFAFILNAFFFLVCSLLFFLLYVSCLLLLSLLLLLLLLSSLS